VTMKLSSLTAVFDPSPPISADPEIAGLAYDSRRVTPGALFFALRGVAVDGHRFIGQAVT